VTLNVLAILALMMYTILEAFDISGFGLVLFCPRNFKKYGNSPAITALLKTPSAKNNVAQKPEISNASSIAISLAMRSSFRLRGGSTRIWGFKVKNLLAAAHRKQYDWRL